MLLIKNYVYYFAAASFEAVVCKKIFYGGTSKVAFLPAQTDRFLPTDRSVTCFRARSIPKWITCLHSGNLGCRWTLALTMELSCWRYMHTRPICNRLRSVNLYLEQTAAMPGQCHFQDAWLDHPQYNNRMEAQSRFLSENRLICFGSRVPDTTADNGTS